MSRGLDLHVADILRRLLFGCSSNPFSFPAFPHTRIPGAVPARELALVEPADDKRALEGDRVDVAGDVAPGPDEVAAGSADEVSAEDEGVVRGEAGAVPDGRADEDDEAVPRAHAAVDAEVAPRERVPVEGLCACAGVGANSQTKTRRNRDRGHRANNVNDSGRARTWTWKGMMCENEKRKRCSPRL